MYHAWGSQNAWLRQIHGENPLVCPGPDLRCARAEDRRLGLGHLPHGRIKVPVARMEAVNEKTIWTWNAIGKREGAWALDRGAPEAQKGFLLNHLIHELLPPKGDGLRWSNSDPVTGQAAWYDLRVRRSKKQTTGEMSEPRVQTHRTSPVGQGIRMTWRTGMSGRSSCHAMISTVSLLRQPDVARSGSRDLSWLEKRQA